MSDSDIHARHVWLTFSHLLASEGDGIDAKELFTFDLTADTDCARLGEKAVIIDVQKLNIIVRFQNVNGTLKSFVCW